MIDELVDRAENTIDAGDDKHFAGAPDEAAQEYEDGVEALSEARKVAANLESDQVEKIDQHLRRVRVRQQSLDLSDTRQKVREIVTKAREHAAAGDQAFHDSKYDIALEEYEKAYDRYEFLATTLDEFSFEEPLNSSEVCDVCQQQFGGELDFWQIELGVTLQVCPACARFGSAGNLPSPRDIAVEQQTVRENIESLRDGDVG
ncbi:hypothetical protein [Natronobacterium texcoconense]|uniref:hypothetical protein n=1 Tax=Natronobacterium texcoconense TaxID=1095778 RepID=UPI000B868C99|nr:hypothetical protein [Natronobacterium texcoconense]